MTKNEFFALLEEKLSILDKQEISDILEEYRNHIEFKMNDGKTEEQAIADFGDVDALAEEILSAYHINSETVYTKNGEYYIKAFVSFINRATEKFLSFSLNDVAKVIVEFIFVIIVISLVGIPLHLIGSELSYLFAFLPSPMCNAITSIIKLSFDLINLVFAFIIIYSFVKTRILNRKVVSCSKADTEETQTFTDNAENDFEQPNFDVVTGKPLRKIKKIRKSKEKNTDISFGKTISSIFVWMLKIIAFFIIWLPAVFITISAIVATVFACLLMITKGIGLWGLCITGIGCCIMGIGFTAWSTQMLFGGKKNEQN